LCNALDAALPQTQCTRCGYPDCRGYAQAMAAGQAPINRCPPGGAEGVARLAALTGQPVLPLDPACGQEGPRLLAVIDEDWCIGCTLCITACPVDCIIGAHKRMHTVVDADCTGCELCVPACPVDCISMQPISGALAPDRDDHPPPTGWQAWSAEQATQARTQYLARNQRRVRLQQAHDDRLEAKAALKLADLAAHSRLNDPVALEKKRAVVAAALARAKAKRAAV
jgi:electron transport complex protein RnfB